MTNPSEKDSEKDLEVELKFRVDDLDEVRKAARAFGGKLGSTIRQVDTYYAHPTRNFAETDEALRVRVVGETACVTYKGPLLDAETKSRQETEIRFAGGAADGRRFGGLLARLGFHEVKAVHKEREEWHLDWQGKSVELLIDRVDGLGTFVELEMLSDAAAFEEAKAALLALASTLGLRDSERRSYLALLLTADQADA